jgi:hypothetical protein
MRSRVFLVTLALCSAAGAVAFTVWGPGGSGWVNPPGLPTLAQTAKLTEYATMAAADGKDPRPSSVVVVATTMAAGAVMDFESDSKRSR